jgi:hypothetical protein
LKLKDSALSKYGALEKCNAQNAASLRQIFQAGLSGMGNCPGKRGQSGPCSARPLLEGVRPKASPAPNIAEKRAGKKSLLEIS